MLATIHDTRRARTLTALSVLVAATLLAGGLSAQTLTYLDPTGDDNGPGTYTYPTDRAYTRGGFDMTRVEIEFDGNNVNFIVEVNGRIEDPWDSPAWNGNGFSIQFAQVYIDGDRQEGSGWTQGLPGVNVQFAPEEAWDRVVLISPQPASRVRAEIAEKASSMAAGAIVPDRTSARGSRLTARVPRSALPDSDPSTWGVQVLMQSNEGYPLATDLLTRRVNEFEGPHRFGGGHDGDCDPHVMDILAGEATGDRSEIQAQHEALGSYTCNDDGTGTLATVPMIYRQ
jgi:carbohydrate-binding DOMON domain-containing protein